MTTAPDGLIADVVGAFAGRKPDHQVILLFSCSSFLLSPSALPDLFLPRQKQNESNLSGRLFACQAGNEVQYDTSTDKGFHTQPCINTMYNHLINTPAQNFSNDEWAAMRVANENSLSLVVNQWKYIDFRKIGMVRRQPLGLYFKLACFLTNCITCLDHNEISIYFNCPPLSLEQYLA